MTDEELLEFLYHKKHNYGGLEQLYTKAKIQHPSIKKIFVKEWLSNQKQYQLTKTEKVGKKEFLPIYSEKKYSFQIDLTFFPRYKKYNKEYWVLFTAININTRYAFAYYATDKTMSKILNLLKKMAEKTIINSITCDEGSEFNNKEFINYCNENNIYIYFVKDDSHKLGIINRFHRTIKDKLEQYFVGNNLNWINVIDDIIHNYNHTVNRGIGYAPVKVNDEIETNIINKKSEITDKFRKDQITEFKVGNKIRVLRKKKLFEDKLLSKYFDIVFVVDKIKSNSLLIHAPDGTEYKTKKKYCFIINENTEITPITESKIIKAGKENKIKRILKKEEIEEKNLIKEKRIIKIKS